MTDQPLVSILVPVYNSASFLPSLLASVRLQDYQHWELIFVDDLSTDGSREWLKEASGKDSRLQVLYNARNLGPSATLNRAATISRGPLLARLDADDTMLPERISRQVAFMKKHVRVGLLGSFYQNVRPDGRRGKVETTPALDGDALRSSFLFFNPMGHSTVMFRREAFERIGGYDETLRASLDYDVLARLSRATDCAVLPRALVNYLTHAENITTRAAKLQLENAMVIQRQLLEAYGFRVSEHQLEVHFRLHLYRDLPVGCASVRLLREGRIWLRELQEQNLALEAFDPEAFALTLREVHTRLFARRCSTLRLRDYLANFTADFGSLGLRQVVRQVGHSLKNGI